MMRPILYDAAVALPQRMMHTSAYPARLAMARIRFISNERRAWPFDRQVPIAPPPTFGARPIVIQRRFLLGPFLRLARSGFAVTAGAAAGGAAYANHKFSEATGSVSDKFDKATEWVGDMFNKFDIGELINSGGDYSGAGTIAAGSNGSDIQFSQGGNGNGSGTGNNGGYNNNNHNGGQPSGGDNDPAALSAMTAAVSSDEDLNGSFDDQVNAMDNQMINLTRKMIEIRNILLQVDGSENVQLPSIVVIGSQSSGKSSVLEAIVGHEFLPKGSNMVTRRPIELTLVHTQSNSVDDGGEYCEFPNMRLGQIKNFRDVQKTLTELNLAVPASEVVSDEPIQLRIYSPHVPDLTLIDLPGYIQVVAADQPLELKSRIANLCEKYIQPPNVILAVSAADVDLANSAALRASRKIDPQGKRTIGVITKMDLVDAERGVSTLCTREYPLRMGYVGVVTRIPSQGVATSLFGLNSNKTKLIAESEQSFFSSSEYRNVNWGVLKLRDILTSVLEKSMSESLEPTQRAIQRELEETAYAFKVQYNDRVLTPQTYLAQCADDFKVKFQDMSNQFGRDQVRELIKQKLDQKVLDLLAEMYWNNPPGLSSRSLGDAFGDSNSGGSDFSDLSTPKPDLLAWQYKIDQLSASLTKLGIGRLSTSILVDAISERMHSLVSNSQFGSSSLAIDEINDATSKILNGKFYATADQIENSIKPYKYEVDMDAREWQQSREYVCSLLKEELRQCKVAYGYLETEIGGSKLNKLIKSLNALSPSENLDQFSTSLLTKARTAAFLKNRMDLLQARSVFIKSSRCKSRKNKALCPEVFMDVVSNKLAATAVLFLNFELLSDFYYSFPRELDTKMQSLNEDQVELLATQDPKVKRHIELQHRKELLQLALSKLQTISELRKIDNGR